MNRKYKQAIKVELINIFNKPMSDSYFKAKIINGSSKVIETDIYTNSEGLAHVAVKTGSNPSRTKVKIFSGNKIKVIELNIKENLIYEGSISNKFSKTEKTILNEIPALSAQTLELIPYINDIKIKSKSEYTDRSVTIKFNAPKPKVANVKVYANKILVFEKDVFVFDTISRHESKLTNTNSNLRVELLGKHKRNLFKSFSIKTELIGSGSFKKIDQNGNKINFLFTPPPEMSGKSKFKITIDSSIELISMPFIYNTKTPSKKFSEWKLSKHKLNADAHDFLDGSFTLRAEDYTGIRINKNEFKLSSNLCSDCLKITEIYRNKVKFKIQSTYVIDKHILSAQYKGKKISQKEILQDLSFKSNFSSLYESFTTGRFINGINHNFDEDDRVIGYYFWLTKKYLETPSRVFKNGGELRTYQFEQAQQSNNQFFLDITDSPTEFLSHNMHSHIYVSKKESLPSIFIRPRYKSNTSN